MALNGLFCADVPLRNYSLTHCTMCRVRLCCRLPRRASWPWPAAHSDQSSRAPTWSPAALRLVVVVMVVMVCVVVGRPQTAASNRTLRPPVQTMTPPLTTNTASVRTASATVMNNNSVHFSLVRYSELSKRYFFNALTHCVNFFNALINALLLHPGPSKARVGGKLLRVPQYLGAPPIKYGKLKSK